MKRLFTTSIITLRYLVIQIQCLLRVIQITFHQGIAKRIFGTCWSCVKFYSLNSRKFPSDECLKCAIGHIWSVCRAIVSIATNKDKPCGLDLIRLGVSGDHLSQSTMLEGKVSYCDSTVYLTWFYPWLYCWHGQYRVISRCRTKWSFASLAKPWN